MMPTNCLTGDVAGAGIADTVALQGKTRPGPQLRRSRGIGVIVSGGPSGLYPDELLVRTRQMFAVLFAWWGK